MEEKISDKYQELAEAPPGGVKREVPMQDRDPDPEGVGKTPKSAGETVEETIPEVSIPAALSDDGKQQSVQPTDDSSNQSQVKGLCNIAFEKGLDEAIEEAQKLDNPYLLDEFHDALIDKLRQKLIERGKLKQK